MKSIKSIPQSEPLITAKDRKAVNDYLKGGGWLTEHTKTKEFEDGITKFIGSKYCSVVPNGTLGLTLALMALGIKGEVIVPAFTMIASVNAVKLAGAKPVMADIDLDTWCLDLDNLPITDKTQAIMVVHLNGRSPDMDKLVKICKEKHLYLIEDSCQAFGAVELKGDIAVYSLSPHKIITTGQGGLVVTNSQKISEKVRRLKDFGRLDGGEDVFPELGFNFKFTDLQAVIGLVQLSTIEERMEKKRQLYEWYTGEKPDYLPWFIPMLSEKRDEIIKLLKKNKIGSRAFYSPIKEGFPNSEYLSKRGLWLPSSLTLEKEDVMRINEITHSNK